MRASTTSASASASTAKARLNGVHQPKKSSTKTIEDIRDELRAQAADLSDDLDDASPRRKLVGWIMSLSTAFATAWGWNLAVDWATLAAFSVTGSSFLAMLVYVIGIVLAVYGTYLAFSTTFSYAMSSKPDQHWALVKSGVVSTTNKVRSWFNRSAEESPA